MNVSNIKFNPFQPCVSDMDSSVFEWSNSLFQIGFSVKIENGMANSVDQDLHSLHKSSFGFQGRKV